MTELEMNDKNFTAVIDILGCPLMSLKLNKKEMLAWSIILLEYKNTTTEREKALVDALEFYVNSSVADFITTGDSIYGKRPMDFKMSFHNDKLRKTAKQVLSQHKESAT